MTTITFADWLRQELNNRDWTQADLARRSGISPSQVTRIFSGERGIGESSLTAIAHAFKLPPEQVYRAAGILPPETEINELIEQIVHETSGMSEQDQQEVLAFIRMKTNLRTQRKKK